MLEWLKSILGDAYTEDIDKQVSQEIGKQFVSKADFNAKGEKVKELGETVARLSGDVAERDKQLEGLKASTGTAEELKQQIKALQGENAAAKEKYEAELTQMRLDAAVDSALSKSGAKNNIAARALLAEFLKTAKLDDDGTVNGLDGAIGELAKADGTAFLFENTAGSQNFSGMTIGNVGGKTAPPAGKAPKDMSYEELCSFMEQNPEAKIE